jgi:hypothetical protein
MKFINSLPVWVRVVALVAVSFVVFSSCRGAAGPAEVQAGGETQAAQAATGDAASTGAERPSWLAPESSAAQTSTPTAAPADGATAEPGSGASSASELEGELVTTEGDGAAASQDTNVDPAATGTPGPGQAVPAAQIFTTEQLAQAQAAITQYLAGKYKISVMSLNESGFQSLVQEYTSDGERLRTATREDATSDGVISIADGADACTRPWTPTLPNSREADRYAVWQCTADGASVEAARHNEAAQQRPEALVASMIEQGATSFQVLLEPDGAVTVTPVPQSAGDPVRVGVSARGVSVEQEGSGQVTWFAEGQKRVLPLSSLRTQ